MVAPIGRNGEPGDIYRWIAKQHARREDEKAKRLLYVAATRAAKNCISSGPRLSRRRKTAPRI